MDGSNLFSSLISFSISMLVAHLIERNLLKVTQNWSSQPAIDRIVRIHGKSTSHVVQSFLPHQFRVRLKQQFLRHIVADDPRIFLQFSLELTRRPPAISKKKPDVLRRKLPGVGQEHQAVEASSPVNTDRKSTRLNSSHVKISY